MAGKSWIERGVATRLLLVLTLLVIGAGLLPGCSGGGEGSGGGSGTGYTIYLTVTQNMVPTEGQTTVIADIRSTGKPVPDGDSVSFSSLLGGSFADDSGATTIMTSGGRATARYTAPKTDGGDKITASYKGAYAYVWINVYKP